MSADPFRLDGRTVLVTAGCAGLGRDVVEAACARGARVVATSRDAARAAEANRAFAAAGLDARAATTDLRDADARRLMVEIAAETGGVDVLVNVAGGRFAAETPEAAGEADFVAQYVANVVRAFEVGRAAVDAPGGRLSAIVNVGSIYGTLAVDHRIYDDPARQSPVSYAAAKAGLAQMTRYMAAYWAPRGVRVNCVSPGGIERAQDPAFLERYGARVPMGRMGRPEEVVSAILFLAMPASGYVTGTNLLVDGGMHVW